MEKGIETRCEEEEKEEGESKDEENLDSAQVKAKRKPIHIGFLQLENRNPFHFFFSKPSI